MTKVSVIVPVYNVEEYLQQALDSVVNQTLRDIEIICIDDKSTDNSLKILKEYASKDNRFVIIEQETNQGQGVARNLALDVAKGEYIMFLDSDDWYEVDTCEIAYNQILKNKNDFVIFNYCKVYENYKEFCYNKIKPFKKVIDNQNIKLKNVQKNFFVNGFTWCLIYSKEFLNKNNIRFADLRLCEDVPFNIKSYIYADNISIIDKSLYNYRCNNTSSSNNIKKWHDVIEARKIALVDIKNCPNGNVFIKKYNQHCIKLILHWYFKFTPINQNIQKDFYNSMMEFFETDLKISKIKLFKVKFKVFKKTVLKPWLNKVFNKENIIVCKNKKDN